MNKFIVKSIAITNNYDFSINYQSLNAHYPTCSFNLEIFPYGAFDDSVSKLLKSIQEGMIIGIDTDDYAKWVNPFKDEFKQFLITNYPEKIMMDQEGFTKLFGNTK
jgi:hypothetical protein